MKSAVVGALLLLGLALPSASAELQDLSANAHELAVRFQKDLGNVRLLMLLSPG